MPPCPRFYNCYVFRHVQVHGREIPDGAHAAFHQFVRHFLRRTLRHRDDPDQHVQSPDKFYDIRRVKDLHPADLRVDAGRVAVKRRDDVQPVCLEPAVSDERGTEAPRPHNDRVRHVVVAEYAVDVLDEIRNPEPPLWFARNRTDHRQIFAHLHRVQMQLLRHRRGRYRRFPRRKLLLEIPVVGGQPADRGLGYILYLFRVFHVCPHLFSIDNFLSIKLYQKRVHFVNRMPRHFPKGRKRKNGTRNERFYHLQAARAQETWAKQVRRRDEFRKKHGGTAAGSGAGGGGRERKRRNKAYQTGGTKQISDKKNRQQYANGANEANVTSANSSGKARAKAG